MNLERMEEIGKLAEAHKGRQSSKLILELLDYIERLGLPLTTPFGKSGDVGDSTSMPFGKHKGEPMWMIPDEYLSWWAGQHNREGLTIDAEFAKAPQNYIARQHLRLYDYVQRRLKFTERQIDDCGEIPESPERAAQDNTLVV